MGRKMFNDRGKRSREAWLQHRGEHRRGAPFMLYLLLMSNTPARGETEFICWRGGDVKGDGGSGGVYLMVSSW